MQVSALPYTDEQLAPPEYAIDLPASSATVVTLSARTLGVGTASCGPRTLDPYITWSDPFTFGYTLRLLPRGQRDFAGSGRQPGPRDHGKPAGVPGP